MKVITVLYAVLVVACAAPLMGQDIPLYKDTLWHVNANQQLYPFNGPSNSLAYAPLISTLFAGTEVGLIALYDAETGVLKDTILLAQRRIYALDVSADGTRIYVYHQDSATTRDYTTMAKGQIIEYPSKRVIVDSVPMGYTSTRISPDGRYVAAGANWVYDIQAGVILNAVDASLYGHSYCFTENGSRVLSAYSVSPDHQIRFRIFDYKNQRMDVDTNLGAGGFGSVIRTHGDKVAILTHPGGWVLSVYRLPSMEKIWGTRFSDSDGGGLVDFVDENHVICRKYDPKYGLGTWIFRIDSTVVGLSKPIAQAVGWGSDQAITSKDGRFLFCTGNATLYTIDVRSLTTGVNDQPNSEHEVFVYPNPTTGTFTARLETCNMCDVSWEMINVSGEKSAVGRGSTDQSGNITSQVPMASSGSALPSGRYTLRMRSGARTWSFILVVL